MFFETSFAKPTLATSDANDICHQDNGRGSLLLRVVSKGHIAETKIAASPFKSLIEVLLESGLAQISPQSGHDILFLKFLGANESHH